MAQKLYAIYSLKYYIEFFMKTQKNYMQTFIYSNFNYSLVVWHFSSAATNKKTESIQKPVIRFLYENHYLWQLNPTLGKELWKLNDCN